MQGNNQNFSRLEILLSALEVNQKELAAATGLSTSVVSHYVTGERQVSPRSALEIQKAYPQVNADWLLTGQGEMLKGGPDTQTVEEMEADDTRMLAEMRAKLDEVLRRLF